MKHKNLHNCVRLILAALFALTCPMNLTFARQPTTRVNVDEGNDRVIFSVKVDSITPVSIFLGVNFGASTEAKDSFHRDTIIINPSANYELMVGSSPQSFPQQLPGSTSQYFTIDRSSGSWQTLNSTTFYALYPPGASTETVRGYINKEK